MLPRIVVHVADDRLTREEELFARGILLVLARTMRVERLIGARAPWKLTAEQVHEIVGEMRVFAKTFLPDIDVRIEAVATMPPAPKGARGTKDWKG